MNQFAFLAIPNTDGQYHVRLSYHQEDKKLQVVVTGPNLLSAEMKNITSLAEMLLETGEFVYLSPQPQVLIEVRGGVAYDETPEGVPVDVSIKDYDDDYGDEEEDDYDFSLYSSWQGGECPVGPNDIVKIWLRDSTIAEGVAKAFDWDNADRLEDIIAYRVVEKFTTWDRPMSEHEAEYNAGQEE